jgi:hypothetical protein
MPKYYCEYCNIYLTQSSPHSRKQHVTGRRHIQNKIDYYTEFLIAQQTLANSGELYSSNPALQLQQQYTAANISSGLYQLYSFLPVPGHQG